MTTIWPVTLPQEMILQGLSETAPDRSVRTKMEFGPERIRRRTTTAVREIKGMMVVTEAQRQVLDDFYLTNEALPFEWYLPFSGATATFTFSKPPVYTNKSGNLQSVALEFKAR